MDHRSRESRLRQTLTDAFAPSSLEISDDSHLHAGHAGASDGRGHYSVRIAAAAFRGLTPLSRHRLIYTAVADLLATEIHALAIDARVSPGDEPPLER